MDSRLQKQGYRYLLWWLWVSGPQPAGQMAGSSTSIIYLIVCFRIAASLLYSKSTVQRLEQRVATTPIIRVAITYLTGALRGLII